MAAKQQHQFIALGIFYGLQKLTYLLVFMSLNYNHAASNHPILLTEFTMDSDVCLGLCVMSWAQLKSIEPLFRLYFLYNELLAK